MTFVRSDGSAPLAISALIAAARSFSAAKKSGVCPHSALASVGVGALLEQRRNRVGIPGAAARCNAVAPLASVRFGSAPAARSALTTAGEPVRLANWSGV